MSLTHRGCRLPLALAAAALLLVATACGDGQHAPEDRHTAAPDDPGPLHVHGLGRNPADDLVYIATHTGLWRLDEQDEPERVAQVFNDFMGFTVVGPDHFLASGHPSPGTDQPPLLGLIESRDGGVTWQPQSLHGSADFHALRAAHGHVYGWSSADGTFMVRDDGNEWDRRSRLALLDFAVHPHDPDVLVASTADAPGISALAISSDGGRTWTTVDARGLDRLSWQARDRLFAVGLDGRVHRSRDEGAAWEEVGALPGRAGALLDTGEALYAAAGQAILRSDDDGATWRELFTTSSG